MVICADSGSSSRIRIRISEEESTIRFDGKCNSWVRIPDSFQGSGSAFLIKICYSTFTPWERIPDPHQGSGSTFMVRYGTGNIMVINYKTVLYAMGIGTVPGTILTSVADPNNWIRIRALWVQIMINHDFETPIRTGTGTVPTRYRTNRYLVK